MMPTPHAPMEVSAETAASLIEAQFPELAPARVEHLGLGWDNAAFLVNADFVFRFPRREVAVPLLAKEACLLSWLAPMLPVGIPCPRFLGNPSEAYPWPFLGSTFVTGLPASCATLSDEARACNAIRLGEFLARLHTLRPPEPIANSIGPDTFGRLDFTRRIPDARDRVGRLASLELITAPRRLLAVLDAEPPGFSPRSDVLVHGDLYALHLLVSGRSLVTGVIDWGDAHLGDPATDLMLAHVFLPPSSHDDFRRGYGPIADATWQAARLRALCHSATVLEYAHGISEQALVREAQQALAYIAAA